MQKSPRNQHFRPVFQVLPIHEIDAADSTYATAPDWIVNQALRHSIEVVGVTTPILVQKLAGQPFRVVCGFQRLRLASAADATTIPCLITEQPDARHLFDLALFDNLGARELSDLEKARAVTKLRYELDVPEEEIISSYLPALSIRPDRFHFQRCLATAQLPSVIQRNLSSVPMEMGLQLARWRPEEQEFFLGTIGHYRPSHSNMKRFFTLLDELRAQPQPQGKPRNIAEIWSQSGCQALHQKSREGNASVFHKILKALHCSRYPKFSEMVSRYENNLRALNISQKVRVSAPPFFEGEHLTFQFSVKSPRQLAKVLEQLGAAASATEMDELFDLL